MSVHEDAVRPLSGAQEGIWFAQRLDPANAAYNTGEYVEIHGPLDTGLFETALRRTVAEAETFGLRFTETADGPRALLAPVGDWPLHRVDVSAEPDARAAARAWMLADLATPVELTEGPLFTQALFTAAPDRFFWYQRAHHILLDGYGYTLIARRVAEVYTALAARREPERGFAPLTRLLDEESAYRACDRFAVDRAFWTGQFEGAPEVPSLTEGTAPPCPVSLRRATTLSAADTERLSAAAARLGTGRAELFLAVAAAYVHRATGAEDIVLGLPTMNRSGSAALRIPGVVSNILPLRVAVRPGTSLAQLVRDVAARLRAVRAHQRYRGEDLRRDLRLLGRDRRLYGPVVNLVPFDNEPRFGEHRTTFHHLTGGPVEDLSITLRPGSGGSGLHIAFAANPALYSENQLAEHEARFLLLLRQFAEAATGTEEAADVASLSLLLPGEDPQYAPAPSAPPAPDTTLPARFEAQSARTPDAIAVTHEGTHLAYAELNARANRLARLLVERGAGPGTVVALALPRSLELITALLSVLKSGAAYLPLDPGYPAERIRMVAEDAGPALLVTHAEVAPALPDTGASVITLGDMATERELALYSAADLGDMDRRAPLTPSDAAYIIHTSGSTGRPKGVVIPHSNVVRLFGTSAGLFSFGPDDVWTLFHSYAFDFSVWEIWGPLLHGGRLVVVPQPVTRSPGEFLQLLRRERVTVLNQTPSAFQQLIQADREEAEGAELALRYVIFGGEALEPAHLRAWVERYGDEAPALVNMYGITETTVHVTFQRVTRALVEADRASSVIGTALPDLRVYVLDRCRRPVPPGWTGEMYVSGPGLARGYLNRPELTAERFVSDPFGPEGARMYRTGDLARRLSDGTLEYAGRADRQLKIRGFRIEPGEIEAALGSHPEVAQAAVVARETEHGTQLLVAYAVPAAGRTPEPAALRAHLAAALPEHMVPNACVVLPSLPLTLNGKLDAKALPTPDFTSAASGRAAATRTEERLCRLFEEVLRLPDGTVGVDDDFFSLGGHSLLATRLLTRVRATLDVEIGMAAVFEAPRPGELAALLDVSAPAGGEARPILAPAARPERLPLSPAQARIWFLNRLEGSSPTYNIPFILALSAGVDAGILREALVDVCARHEALRTVFPDDGGDPWQLVREAHEVRPELEVVDVAADELRSRVHEAARAGFDLSAELPLRCHLFSSDDGTNTLLLVLHHIAADGWSLVPLAQDLAEAYTARAGGRAPKWGELPVQYGDYTLWQSDLLGDPADPQSHAGRQLAHWEEHLAGLPEQLDLPYDRPRERTHTYAGDAVPIAIDAELHRSLNELAVTHRASVFMVLQAALSAAMTLSGAGTDIPLGTAVAGRDDVALDSLVGFFSNTLVLRTDTSGDPSFAALLDQVRDTNFAAQAHQDLPFNWLVDRINPRRVVGRHPLFQVMLAMQNAGDAQLEMAGSTVRLEPADVGVSRFDLTLSVAERRGPDGQPEGLAGSMEFSTELFERATVEALIERLHRVLVGATADPQCPLSRLPLSFDEDALADRLPACERSLLAQDGVRECLVSVRTSREGVAEPVAYVVPGGSVDPARLAVAGRAALPATSAPLRVVLVSALPRTDEGALDTEALFALPVLDDRLAGAWQRRLAAADGASGAAVVVRDIEWPTPEPLHIGDLLGAPGQAVSSSSSSDNQHAAPADEARLSLSEGPELRELPFASLTEALRAAAEGDGEVVHVRADGSEDRQSYQRLAQDASRVLRGLRGLGLAPGDKVVLQLADTREFITGFWACAIGGMIAVPLAAPPLGYTQKSAQSQKLESAWQMLGHPLVLTTGSSPDNIAELLRRPTGPQPRIAAIDELARHEEDRHWHTAHSDDLVLLMLTSGSTGAPKAVELRHRNILARTAGTAQINDLGPTDVSFNWMPMDHVGGIVHVHLRDVVLGARQILCAPTWVLEEPLRWLDALSKYRVTWTWAPNFAFGLVNERAEQFAGKSWDLSALRIIANGAESVVVRTARTFIRQLTPYGLPANALHPVWGMAETSSAQTDAVLTLENSHDDDRYVCLGRPYPGTSIRITDDKNQVVPEGTVGHFQILGPSVTSGYHDNPHQNTAAFTTDGWFDTGDLAYLKAGRLTMTGRAKDTIVVNGRNLAPHEIEAVVEEHPAVETSFTAAVAVTTPGSDTDQLALYLVLRPGTDQTPVLRQITAEVTARSGVRPAFLIPVTTQDIPKTEIGKIQRPTLRKQFQDGLFTDTIQRTDIQLGNERTLPNWFHHPIWQRTEPVHGVDAHVAAGHTLVIAGTWQVLADGLAARIAEGGGTSTVVASSWEEALAGGTPVDRVIDLTMAGPLGMADLDPGRSQADARRLAALIAALAASDHRRVTLEVVATESCEVVPGEPVQPARAAAAAVLKSAVQELPWLSGRWTDVDGALVASEPELAATAVHTEIATLASETVVALRGDARWVNRLVALPAPELDSDVLPAFREGGHYLMTGGLGGLAVELARMLLTDHQVSLTLVGRTPLADDLQRAAAFDELRALGAVRYRVADVSDPEAVRLVLAAAEADEGPLDGVLHLAAHFAELPLTQADPAHWDAVLAAKTTGAAVLTDALRERPGTLFVSFSSVNGWFGGAMAAAYSAANAYLDALVVHQRSRGLRAYSIAWSMWDELGASRGYALKELTRARGFRLISGRDGLRSLAVALRHDTGHILVGLDPAAPWVRSHLDAPAEPLQHLAGYVTGSVASDIATPESDRFGVPVLCAVQRVDELPDGTGDYRLAVADAGADEPATPLEKALAEVWCELLGIDRVGRDDNFFALGGNSLLVTRLVGRIRTVLGVGLGVADLFARPTIAELAQGCAGKEERPPLVPMQRPDPMPLSLAQTRLWFIDRLEGPSATYNIPVVLRFPGPLDSRVLRRALTDVVGRHEALRTMFPERDGLPVQLVVDAAEAEPDLFVAQTPKRLLEEQVRSVTRMGFALDTDLPLRAHLFHLPDDTSVLVLMLHHIAADGWSLTPLAEDLAAAYRARAEGRSPQWDELSVQYGDYTLWQRQLLGEQGDPESTAARQLAFWERELNALPDELRLPYDRPRPQTPSREGRLVHRTFAAGLHARLTELGQEHNTTLFMVVQAAVSAALTRSGAGEDIPLGTVLAGRTDHALTPLVGFFVNTLVLRTDTSADPAFTELLRRVRETTSAAHVHQDLPFDTLVEKLNPRRHLARHPLFQVSLAMNEADSTTVELAGMPCVPERVHLDVAKFDLAFVFSERRGADGRPAGLDLAVEYSTDLFDAATAQTLADLVGSVLTAAAGDPSLRISELGGPEPDSGAAADLDAVVTAVLGVPGVRECVAAVRPGTDALDRLVIHAVPDRALTAVHVADRVRRALPDLRPPLHVVLVSTLPRTADGKPDTEALAQLPVLDDGLTTAWRDWLLAESAVDTATVAIEPAPAPAAPRVHLGFAAPAVSPEADTAGAAAAGGPAVSDAPASETYGGDLVPSELPFASLIEALRAAAEGDGEVVHVRADGSEDRQSYQRLAQDASRVLRGLRGLGLAPGDKVVLQLADTREFITGFWACAIGGMIAVPLAAPPLGYTQKSAQSQKLESAWQMLGHPLVLTTGSSPDNIAELLRRPTGPQPRIAAIDELARHEEDRHWHTAHSDDLVLLMLTSGSTGAPKAVELRHRNILARTAGTAQINDLGPTDVSFNWMPMDHVGGIVHVHLRDVVLGARQILCAPTWVLEEPLRWLDALSKYRVTWTWAPNFAFGLVNERAEQFAGKSWDLSALRIIANGAESVVVRTARTFIRQLTPYGLPANALHPVWGMAETSSAQTDAVLTLENSHDDDRYVCLGRPYPGTSIRITDDKNQVVPEGTVGHFQILGPSVTSGYHDNPHQNTAAFTTDGWFDTGDLAYLKAGRLTMTGRAKDTIVVNGRNLAPHEIEAVVEEHPAVETSFTAAVAVTTPGSDTDQLALYLVLRPGTDQTPVLRQITAEVTARSGVRPAFLIPVTTQDIPKTEIGKIQRPTLRKQFQDGLFTDTIQRTDIQLGNERTLPNWFHHPIWQPAARPVPAHRSWSGAHVVLLAEDGRTVAGPLAELIGAHGGRCTVVVTVEALRALDTPADLVVDLRRLRAGDTAVAERVTGLARLITELDEGAALSVVAAFGDVAGVALLKSAVQEIPKLSGRWIDVRTTGGADLVERLHDELLSPCAETHVALDGDERYVSRVAELPALEAGSGIEKGGHHLVTGGLGGIGVELARHLLTRYGGRLTLVGRAPAAEGARAEALRELQGLGDVRYLSADVGEADDVQRLLAEAGEPDGVWHLAGEAGEFPVTEPAAERWWSVLRAKVAGAEHLTEALRHRRGMLFVSFSSVNGHFGGAMTGAYAAANACLDELAVRQRELGLRAYSLAWSMWDGTGMSGGLAALRQLTEARGYRVLRPRDAIASLDIALRHDTPHILIGLNPAAPWIRSQTLAPVRPLERLVASVVGGKPTTNAQLPDLFGRSIPCTIEIAKEEAPAEPADGLTQALTSIWAEVLKREDAGPDDSFFDLGGHSILLISVRSLVKQHLGLDIQLADLFTHPTPAAMARHLGGAAKPAIDSSAGAARAARQKQARARSKAAARKAAVRKDAHSNDG